EGASLATGFAGGQSRAAPARCRVHAGTPPPSPCRRGYRRSGDVSATRGHGFGTIRPQVARARPRQNRRMLELFPDGARIEDGTLALGGVSSTDLTREFGTPLLVYDEATI